MDDKFDFLLNKANIGIYNKCEIIEIFGFNKEKKEPFNIYTLIVFENTKQKNMNEMMTNKLQSFKGHKKISWGIKRTIIDIEKVQQLYMDILEKNEYQIDNSLNIGKLKLLPEQYVPPRESMHKAIQINNILKNNFHNGSYILEFFDEDKTNIKFLLDNFKILKEFSRDIKKYLPINIFNIYERLGNIVFQFPINNFNISLNSIIKKTPKRYAGITIEIVPKNINFNLKNLAIRIFEYNDDNLLIRQRYKNVKKNITKIRLDDCVGTHIEIIDKNTSLLLYKYKYNILKQINFKSKLIGNQKRVFKINEKIKKIEISYNERDNRVFGKEKFKSFSEWISNRRYEQELKKFEESKIFIQYFKNQEDKVLEDVRWLINQHGEQGVYLWDPYLSAIDIKKTLYYAKNTYMPMKAISGLKQHQSKEQAKQDMLDEFQKDKKEFLFLDLEVRGKIGTNGYDFHDRFLIFPSEIPKAWSLGISVNQLGKSHHILQKVENAQHILNAFNKLWNELDSEECLVWKSN